MSHPDELASAAAPLYAARRGVFPKQIDGRFRRLKWAIMAVTLAIYYATPWIRWDRGPYAPDQAVLIDLAHRRFYMFSIEIWPHEFYYVAGLLIMAGIGLFLVTSTVGRAWCGYACPQTVWTDLFQHVDRFVDGDRNAQIRLQNAPITWNKFLRRAAKYGIYLFIAFWTGGAWIMYFADAPTLTREFWTGEAPLVAYATVGVLTATTFIFGGFMREQVCIYMCPWPRIQTALMDEKSLVVTYKNWRGEPRGSVKKAESQPGAFGDCIDCNQCVAVCPTGIDIREGPQIGCITCALCIDACDRVMAQVGRRRGLIDYVTEESAHLEQQGKPAESVWKTLLRPRTIAYFMLWGGIGLAMLFVLGNRERLGVSALQDRNPQYVQLSDGSVRNNYTVKIRNMESRPRSVEISLDGLVGGVIWTMNGARDTAGRRIVVETPPDAVAKVRVFAAAPATGERREAFRFAVRGLEQSRPRAYDDVFFDRPEGSQ
jgi:cytochrome c oxidase accessory protein FixG